MIKVIIGPQGSGKTSRIIEELNRHAENDMDNVVAIERGKRMNGLVNYRIRLVDIDEYPTLGFRELGSFIAGMLAKDYDITHIYIDSIYKVAGSDSEEELVKFLNYLEPFTKDRGVTVKITMSGEPDDVNPHVAQFVSLHEAVH